ncbi:Uncharacterised protein [Helicobacter pametensis]|nr:Uncharacterised protein [Helicobacter pametensis]
MIPKRIRYECPQCKRRESHTEGCLFIPRICSKCKIPLIIKNTSFNLKSNPKEILDAIFNLFK